MISCAEQSFIYFLVVCPGAYYHAEGKQRLDPSSHPISVPFGDVGLIIVRTPFN